MSAEPDALEPHLLSALQAGEALLGRAKAVDATLAASDRRLLVASDRKVELSVPFERLRRIEFDIERDRPATLVIVPDHPQVLSIPPTEYRAVAEVLVRIGLRLVGDDGPTT